MLNETVVRENAQRRLRLGMGLVPVATFVTAVCTFTLPNLALPAFVLLLVILAISAVVIERIKTICPTCSANVSSSYKWLLVTRCCPACDERIVAGGVVRRPTVYRRYLQIKGRSLLKLWLWSWPLFTIAGLVIWFFAPSAMDSNPIPILVVALLGVGTASYSFLRTFDFRYLPQLVTSACLLLISVPIALYG